MPKEVLRLVEQGVDVHSVQNLHAKVFVTGQRAFIGSTNASSHSANGLIEACVQTDNRRTVAACRQFVKSLRGELITPEHCKKMQRLYRPPKFGTPPIPRASRKKLSPRHSPLWFVPLVLGDWDEEDYKQEKQGLPSAKKQLRSSRRFKVEDFRWRADTFLKRLKKHDLLIQELAEGDKRVMVSPPARVIHVRPYKKGRFDRAIVYVESARGIYRKNLKAVTKQVGPMVKKLCRGSRAQSVRDWSLAHALLNVWPSANGRS